MTQMLIYENLKPVTRQEHGDISLKRDANFAFARSTNAVPLVIGEFATASLDYAIVFTETSDGVVPAAILGVRDKENVYVKDDGAWDGSYIPAFVRRYPFVFSTNAEAITLTLLIDETYPGFNSQGRGERLFDADGAHTVFLEQTLNFLKEYQVQFQQSRAFGAKLQALGLLDAVEARVPLPNDPDRRLTGFKVVNREKLAKLPDETLGELMRSGELELIYLHLASMGNMRRLQARLLSGPAAPEPKVKASTKKDERAKA